MSSIMNFVYNDNNKYHKAQTMVTESNITNQILRITNLLNTSDMIKSKLGGQLANQ